MPPAACDPCLHHCRLPRQHQWCQEQTLQGHQHSAPLWACRSATVRRVHLRWMSGFFAGGVAQSANCSCAPAEVKVQTFALLCQGLQAASCSSQGSGSAVESTGALLLNKPCDAGPANTGKLSLIKNWSTQCHQCSRALASPDWTLGLGMCAISFQRAYLDSQVDDSACKQRGCVSGGSGYLLEHHCW